MVMHSPLDDSETATIAWARYRRLMWGMALVSLVAVVIAILYLHWSLGDAMTIHMVIAPAAGVGLSVLLGPGLEVGRAQGRERMGRYHENSVGDGALT